MPGIGIKTAAKLLQKFHTLDGVFQSVDKSGLAKKLEGRQEEAALYKSLATVRSAHTRLHHTACPAQLVSHVRLAFADGRSPMGATRGLSEFT